MSFTRTQVFIVNEDLRSMERWRSWLLCPCEAPWDTAFWDTAFLHTLSLEAPSIEPFTCPMEVVKECSPYIQLWPFFFFFFWYTMAS